jgi:hypothetical protein
MDSKLALLFLLIGTVVVLSQSNDGWLSRMRRQGVGRWRGIGLRRKP